jgi:glycosyltransferase involved in cell wall biosynthesis
MRLVIIDDNTLNQTNGVVTTMNAVKQQLFQRGIHSLYHVTPEHFCCIPAFVYPGAKLALNSWKLGNMVENLNPTHLHICTEGVLGIAARTAFRNRGWQYTTSAHTRWDLYLNKTVGCSPKWGNQYMRWFHRQSSTILVNTDSMKTELENQGWNNLKVWTRGVDRHIFDFKNKPIGSKPILLSVGRISSEKNLDAFCRLDFNKYQLVCVGDGPELPRLKRDYPWVRFLGQLKGKMLAEQYQKADVFVFPSVTDTFGLVMIESMSTGTPVAAFPAQGPVDVIEPGVTGFFDADLEIAIEKCLSLSRNTVYEGSKAWSWETTADIFLDTLVPIN